MADEQPSGESKVTPKGAVEIDEETLDHAAGGLNNKNVYDVSLNFNKLTGLSGQEGLSQGLAGTGPGGGPHVSSDKTI